MFLLFKIKCSSLIVLVFTFYFTYRWQGRLHLLSDVFSAVLLLENDISKKPWITLLSTLPTSYLLVEGSLKN